MALETKKLMHSLCPTDRPNKEEAYERLTENMERECKTIATPAEEQEGRKGKETLPRSSAREGKKRGGKSMTGNFSGQTFWVCFRVTKVGARYWIRVEGRGFVALK